ncbi:MAG: glycosyltransferase [Planctomycetota bacterium]
MRIGIQTWGSAGDIRPFIALSAALRSAGHDVTLVVTSVDDADYSDLCRPLGLRPLLVPKRTNADLPRLLARVDRRPTGMKVFRIIFEEFFFPYLPDISRASADLVASNDVLVAHFAVVPLKMHAAKARKPFASVVLWPGLIPTVSWPPVGLPNLGRTANRLAWKLARLLLSSVFGDSLDLIRSQAGLSSFKDRFPEAWFSDRLDLVAASPHLWKSPPDWSPIHVLTGFFDMPSHAGPSALSPSLTRFLDSGDPPLFMTFGSTQGVDPERAMDLMLAAARKVPSRVIMRTTSPRFPPDTSDGDLFFVDNVPHALLFPRCSAVFHHGGAGTTHTAARAGRPSVVVACMEEQYSWGRTLARLGVAPPPLRYFHVTPDRLAGAIRATLASSAMRSRAEDLGEKMRSESGLPFAVSLLERLVSS